MILLLAIALGLCAAGLFSAALLPFHTIRAPLDALAGDGSAEPYTETVHQRLQLAAVVFGLFSLAGLAVVLKNHRRCAESVGWASRQLQIDVQDVRTALSAAVWEMRYELIVLSAIGAGLRLMYLQQPMRFDEAYTWLQYARWPWYIAVSRYDDPNNHVFHTLCVNVVAAIFGNSPAVIRLPALTAGILMVPVAMLWARSMSGRTAAVIAGAILACSSPLIEYSTNARGYTIVGLATILSGLLAHRLLRSPRFTLWVALAIVLALGCWTIPVMLYPLLVLFAWWGLCLLFMPELAGRRSGFALSALACLAATTGLAAILYVPVVITRGIGGFIERSAAPRQALGDVFSGYPQMVEETAGLLFRDQNHVGIAIIVIGAALSATLGSRNALLMRRCAWGALLLVSALPLIQGVLPYPRVWLFLLPWGVVLCAAGLEAGMTRLSGTPALTSTGLILASAALAPAVHMVVQGSVLTSLETGSAPDAEAIARDIPVWAQHGEPVVAIVPVSAPLVYYAHRQGMDDEHFAPRFWEDKPVTSALVIVSKLHGQSIKDVLEPFQLEDALDRSTAKLVAEYPHATVFRVKSDH